MTERFSEAGGVAGETGRLGAWSEVVTESCNAGTGSRLEAQMEDIGERIVDVPMSEKVQECVGEVRLTPHERVQRRTAELVVDVPVRQMQEETVEEVRLVPYERVQKRIKVDDILVVVQRQIPMVHTMQKTPQLHFVDTVGDLSVVVQRQTSMTQAGVEALQVQVRAMSNEIQGKTSGREEFFHLSTKLVSLASISLTVHEEVQINGTHTVNLFTNSNAGSGTGGMHGQYADGSLVVQ